MRNTLYPLIFKPILKDVIWGGSRLRDFLKKPTKSDSCGESWEISGVQGQISIVSNGFLAGNNLQEIIEIYMGELFGDYVYENFGVEFPLLIKFIDANDILSIQVHPDDVLAVGLQQDELTRNRAGTYNWETFGRERVTVGRP